MRYWGNRRHQPDNPPGDDGVGRHRKSKDASQQTDPTCASGSPDKGPGGHRRAPPRDALGRFRKAEAPEEHSAAPVDRLAAERQTARNGTDKPRYSWRDFELGDELPRVEPRSPDSPDGSDGRRHCGRLEGILYRQWDSGADGPPPDVVRAVESLAALPPQLKDKLVEGLDGIYVGPGGVPELDDMDHLRGQPLPSGKATWDICAGAYGDRKIIVGDQPSPTPDVMMHEVGHALDDLDGEPGGWQSDSTDFRALYEQCLPHLTSDFHQQPNDLGRHEFFADAFAAIASRQRPALVDMLGGDTRSALNVMLFFNRRYGI